MYKKHVQGTKIDKKSHINIGSILNHYKNINC